MSISRFCVCVGLVLAAGRTASAQPSATPAPAAAGEVEVAARPDPRWVVGLHVGGVGLMSEAEEEKASDAGTGDPPRTKLGGGGGTVGYRLAHRWELQLDFFGLSGDLPGGLLHRKTAGVVLDGLFHFYRGSAWTWSAILGVGAARDAISAEKMGQEVTQARFEESVGRIGVGVERRFGQLGLAAQLYGIGFTRNDDKLDGPDYVGRDGPVPMKACGSLFQIGASYHF
jgi:hypothetical protein